MYVYMFHVSYYHGFIHFPAARFWFGLEEEEGMVLSSWYILYLITLLRYIYGNYIFAHVGFSFKNLWVSSFPKFIFWTSAES